ncbi:hypothetical protein EBR43_02010 [bacterium]|jgi:hypothetical protein|nr:hypothetical protein [bacterium]NBW56561.1 hypothetical protein [bacterium]NBX72498.1 hypothetical protein [bacterium]
MDSFVIKDIFCHQRLRRLDSAQTAKRSITVNESNDTNFSKLLESISKALPLTHNEKRPLQNEVVEQPDNITVH